ncbi:Uncharacterised protein [Vibrio cholerae]|nr:Uncharacterised protein [Vibrio cholerae]
MPPNKRPIDSNNCSASLVFCSTKPINTNSGTAINTVFSMID